MSIKDIKIVMDWCLEGDTTIAKRLDLIQKQRNSVEAQISQMQDTLNTLRYKEWFYTTANKYNTCSFYDFIPQEEIPEEFRN